MVIGVQNPLKSRHDRYAISGVNSFGQCSDKACLAIQDYIEHERVIDSRAFDDSPFLFLPAKSRKRGSGKGQLSTKAIERLLEKLSRDASAHLPEDQKFIARPHMLRHTHAYRVLEKGHGESFVKERLGHQTMNHVARYTKMRKEEEMALVTDLED